MKHNNNLNSSSHARCRCGRNATIGEWKAGIGLYGSYTCPDCKHQEFLKYYANRMGIQDITTLSR